MPYVYWENMTFDLPSYLDIPKGSEWTTADFWTLDCGGKKDYDPNVIQLSCRVYPDGDYSHRIYCWGDEIGENGILHAESVADAKAAVEKWCEETAERIAKAVKAEFKETPNDTPTIR